MDGNTTAAATDAIWLSVAAVRGPLEEMGYQSLAFSPGMSRNSVPGDPSVVELDSSALCNATVSVEVASKMYKAVLHSMDDKGSAGPNSTSYYLKHKKKVGSRGKAKANG